MTAREKFLAEIEAYLAATGMTPTDFGLAALNDGSFVGRVRDGRAPNLNTVERVRSWMAAHPLVSGGKRQNRRDCRTAA